jgi:two-component system cell cycle sensor histidine kinase/response regulator CckA
MSDERFQIAFRNAAVGMAVVGVDGRFLEVNQALCQMLDYTEQELLSRTFQDVTYPDDHPLGTEFVRRLVSGEIDHGHLEKRYLRRDGTPVWVVVSSTLIRDAQGNPLHFITHVQDVDQRKQAEEALRRSEVEKSLILGATSEMFVYYDTDLRILWANKASADSVGQTIEELVGRHCYEIWHGRTQPCDNCPVLKAGEMRQPHSAEVVTPDGRAWYLRGYPVVDEGGQVVALIEFTQDITQRKRAEEERDKLQAQLIQSQKMEAMGRLTAGIAHDFNNLLTVIMGFAELMKMRMVADDPLHEPLDKIRSAGATAASLIQQLMAFSRQQVMQPQVLDLNVVLSRTEKMLRRIIGEDIALEITPADGLWPVVVDPTQLQQVIVNLVVNARDAMPRGGCLSVQTGNVTLDAQQAAGLADARPGDYVALRISDTGCGMSREVQTHIFEPFFTTKPYGTGLGLPTVYGIVIQSGGFVQVHSVEGQGTTFTVHLPRSAEAAPATVEQPVAAMGRGVETILVVEDSDVVRQYVCEVLREQGYTVLEAGRGHQALRVAAEHAGPIHLLLADVVMHDMSGCAVAEGLVESRPGLKILFMSGYTDDAIEVRGAVSGGVAFLQKPFNALNLTRAVRRILSRV